MKRGGIIEGGIWCNAKVLRLSPTARLLYLYILACPHASSVGAYVLHPGYVLADLHLWGLDSLSQIEAAFVELEAELIDRDHTNNLIRVRGYWGHNVPAWNPNVAKAIVRQALQLPKSSLRRLVVDALAATGTKWMIQAAKQLRKTPNYLTAESSDESFTESSARSSAESFQSKLPKAHPPKLRPNLMGKGETPEPTRSAGASPADSESPTRATPTSSNGDGSAAVKRRSPPPTEPPNPLDDEPDDIPFGDSP